MNCNTHPQMIHKREKFSFGVALSAALFLVEIVLFIKNE